MSFSLSGMSEKVNGGAVEIKVSSTHSLVELANALNWVRIGDLALEDLKLTTRKRCWWVGRKLLLRVHLGVLVLQSLLNKTDRQIEEEIKHNGAYRLFCGSSTVAGWYCPDHTKIEEFRNRLRPDTQREIGISVVQTAQEVGFADPSWVDVDSTVQEANMAYPSDAHLMVKLAAGCQKVADFFKKTGTRVRGLSVDLKAVKAKACAYFFANKRGGMEHKRALFKKLYQTASSQVRPLVGYCEKLKESQVWALPWNIRAKVNQIRLHARQYLKAVRYFIRTHKMKTGKILSFHLKEVACIMKGKVGKDKEFGRVFQLMRIGGNFILPLPAKAARSEDKKSIEPMLGEHRRIFGAGTLKSLGTDKGYYSRSNVRAAKTAGVKEIAIQYPGNLKRPPTVLSRGKQLQLRNRRAGMEPLIGHVKRRGLERSRMKSDLAIEASGYRATMGFNLHQISRYQRKQRLALAQAGPP
jgi:IS5 family transposase